MSNQVTWSRIARRVRVPLGFVFAIVYLWLARPTVMAMLIGTAIVVPGLALRAIASGHLRKNEELTTTGPYAYTRNPLYLGSMLIGLGFALAARNWWIGGLLLLMFFAIYWPVIRSEEEYLRQKFPAFGEYAAGTGWLLPRPRFSRPPRRSDGGFSWDLYRKHREYNALLGCAAMLAFLALKLTFLAR